MPPQVILLYNSLRNAAQVFRFPTTETDALAEHDCLEQMEQTKPYMEYFSEAEDKAAALAFCQERMQADITTEAPRLKEMRREIDDKLRHMGGTGSMQIEMRQQALDHIRIAPDPCSAAFRYHSTAWP